MSGADLRANPADPPRPNPPSPYVELGVQSAFSFGRGASAADDLVLRAFALGYDAIGVTDANTLAGVVRMHTNAKQACMRAVVGCRLEPVDGPALLAWPRDRAAYSRLCRMVTEGRMAAGEPDEGGERRMARGRDCALTLAHVAANAEGLVLATAPPAHVSALEEEMSRLIDVLPLTHVAVSYLYRGDDRARIARLDVLVRAHGLKLLATNDVLYADRSDRPLADVITCIRERTTLDDAGFALEGNGERHLKSPAEMARLFRDWPHAVCETRRVADACAFTLDELRYEYPEEPVPPGETDDGWLRHRTLAGAAERYPGGVPETVRATIEEELALVATKRIARYFLTVRDIVHYARSRGILCQGRGSAANSAICFCLGITNVDPARQNVLFERFLSDARDEPPDIDVDFEHERREEVIQHIYERYGRHRAGLAATVIHYRPRMAIREVGRVMGLSEHITAALAKTVWGQWGTGIFETQVREAGLDPADPLLRRTVALATRLCGLPRHLSQHVGGFVLTQGPLIETVPTRWGAMPDRSYIEWDKDDIEALGIFKVDVLALGMLTALAKWLVQIEALDGKSYTLATIPPEVRGVYDMISTGDTLGVFQIESRAQMAMLPRLRPERFYDLVIEVAIVRPGPIQGDMVHPYLKRRDALRDGTITEIDYPTPGPEYPQDELKNVLERTLGVPIFQEQAMAIAMEAARFDGREANELRRAMATFRSRGTISELQERMVGRMVDRGYDPAFASACFEQIKGFGEYGFPESHAASFAYLVYASCWVKWRYPDVFACGLLNSQPMGFYAPAQIVRDAREHGVEVRPADVNVSDWDCTLERLEPDDRLPGVGLNGVRPPTHALRLGLRMIDGFGAASVDRLLAARADGPFESVAELHARSGLPRDAVEALAAASAFGSCGLSRRGALWDCRGLDRAAPAPLLVHGPEAQASLPLMAEAEEVVADYQTTRLSLRAHPIAFLRERYDGLGLVRSDAMARAAGRRRLGGPKVNGQDAFVGRRLIEVAGLVLVRQRPGSAKGVCFLTIEDEAGSINVVVWPKVMEANRRTVMAARLLRVRGRLQSRDGVTHLVAERLIDATQDLSLVSDAELTIDTLRADHVTHPLPAAHSPPVIEAPPRTHPRDVRIIPKALPDATLPQIVPKAREFH